MIQVTEAIKLIKEHVVQIGTEKVSIDNVVGRILAEDIVADMDLPPFDRSQMDGFAVRSDDIKNAPVDLQIVGESSAGNGWHQEMRSGEAVRIMTGAPVPVGADAVQKVELTSELNFGLESAQNSDGTITILESVAAGRNIVRQGAEVKKGESIFAIGERQTEPMTATLAAFGYSEIAVAKRPRVVIFTTGSEVVEIHEKPGRDQIRNSNSAMLRALAEAEAGEVSLLPTAPDDLDGIKHVIETACDSADIAIITGGVSVGKYDLTKRALIELGAEIFFERVRLKPGKPAVFARLGDVLVFGLPGNPVSAAVTFYLFVRKALLLMQRARETDLHRGTAVANGVFKAAPQRDTYFPIRLEFGSDGRIAAEPVKWIGSSDFVGFGKSNALAFVPRGEVIQENEIVEIALLT